MEKIIKIPEGYEASIDGNTVILEPKISEDEKIRKELIEELKSKLPFCSEEFTKHRIIRQIAYLEKQKEQKPAEKQDYSGLNDLERAIHRGFLSAGVENVSVVIIKETAQECLAQMKSAEWSEEDERMLNNTLDSLKRYQLSMPNYQVELQMRWLKSLCLRSKKKKHLGMKDQWCCSAAWAAVRDSDAYNGEEKQFILDFLQGYEPQPHWKPSEGQMETLKSLPELLRNFKLDTSAQVIEVLYEQLKRL